MDLRSRNGLLPERKRARRTGVVGQQTVKAKIAGGAHGGVDAHVAHGPADGNRCGACLFQLIQQGGLPEAVRKVLLHHGLIGHGRNRRVDLGSGRVRQKKCGAGLGGEVPDVKDRQPLVPEVLQQPEFTSQVDAHAIVSALERPAFLGEVLNSLSSISESLLESYTLLAERARALEGELTTKNAELERKVLEIARSYNVRILGPNCLGLINTGHRMNASFAGSMPRSGGI